MRRRALIVPAIALIVLVLDQVAKYVVHNSLELNQMYSPLPFLKPFVGLIYIHNTGAAFGIFQNQNIFFSVVAVIVIVAIVIYTRRTPEIDLVIAASLGLQLGGAAGNLVDRLRFGYVVDFIYVKYWAISNISDVCITLGVILLGYQLLRHSQPAASQGAALKEANTAPPAPPTDNSLELHQP